MLHAIYRPLCNFFLPFFYATFQCGRYGVFKKNLKTFFDPEKVKKQASKVAHNRPTPFYFTVQPWPQTTAQNWFFILWNLGTRHLFSYLGLLCSIERWNEPLLLHLEMKWPKVRKLPSCQLREMGGGKHSSTTPPTILGFFTFDA